MAGVNSGDVAASCNFISEQKRPNKEKKKKTEETERKLHQQMRKWMGGCGGGIPVTWWWTMAASTADSSGLLQPEDEQERRRRAGCDRQQHRLVKAEDWRERPDRCARSLDGAERQQRGSGEGLRLLLLSGCFHVVGTGVQNYVKQRLEYVAPCWCRQGRS